MNDEFYIGWQSKAPARTGRTLRFAIVTLLAAPLVLALTLAATQRTIGRAVFEWGQVKEFSGMLKAAPVPHLIVAGQATNESATHYLVNPWKFGLDPLLARQFDGQNVTLRGTRIFRDDQRMIEVLPGSIVAAKDSPRSAPGPEPASLGRQTFVGEIVDSKCFLGVMNPGQLKTHRACAVRCISGGIPPVLLVRQADGTARYLLLVSHDGKPVNKAVLSLVAEPVEITGDVERLGDLLVLRADPAAYRRVGN